MLSPPMTCDTEASGAATNNGWSYAEAFSRNLGLVSEAEQEKLRTSRVAIAGMGGVGGVHLVTMARMGIGRFTIADADVFETANFNRQYGATVETIGKPKVEVMAEVARSINPEIVIDVIPDYISPENVDGFLAGADVFVDGVDFFAIEARRLLFAEARERGIWAITAGPIGFSTAWMTFDPHGMSFDRYFDLKDGKDRLDMLIAFAVGLCPRATHLSYTDLSRVDIRTGAAPSVAAACQLASGVAAAEIIKLLTGTKDMVCAAPFAFQLDVRRGIFRKTKLVWGNRGPFQRAKMLLLLRQIGASVKS